MRLLLVEDDADAARVLAKGLREETYAVDLAGDGDHALEQAAVTDYDLIILDVMIPGRDGFEVCQRLRTSACTSPILMLTARDAVEYRVEGLNSGADDYLTKPFDFRELVARVRALLRRGPVSRNARIEVDDLVIDTTARQVTRGGRPVDLTAKEYALLEYFGRRAGEVVGRADIGEHVWDQNFDPFSNLIEVYVQRLRRKLERGEARRLLYTRRGLGYVLTAAASHDDA
jgi:two-component system copper resistance phosphate regulon response regulator CusR